MKKYVSTLAAGLAALSLAGSASAQTTNFVHLVGSTAFRAATMTAITHILNSGFVYGYSGTSFTGASQAEFRGTTISGSLPVDIKVSWSGSVAGIQTLCQNINVANFLNATNLTTAGTQNETGPYDAPENADVAMSDSFQGSSLFTSPQLTGATTGFGGQAGVVGVVPFKWVRNAGSPSTMSNVTSLLVQVLYASGQIPLSELTGLNSDEGTVLTALGRDEDSGTRLDAFADSGFGQFSAPLQYEPLISGTPGPSGTITNIIAWPPNTVDGISYPTGHSGYSSGGTLSAAMQTPGSLAASGGWFITYLGLSDATTLENNGGFEMTYNGVPYSNQAIEEGEYTFWSYEHMYYRSSFTGNPQTIANLIATQVRNTDGTVSGILIPSMNVGRAVEGGVITFGNPY